MRTRCVSAGGSPKAFTPSPAERSALESLRTQFDDLKIRANIRDAVDGFDKEARKSSALAQREAQLESEANQAWVAARQASDFSLFAGKLTEIFELKKEVAAVTRPGLSGAL